MHPLLLAVLARLRLPRRVGRGRGQPGGRRRGDGVPRRLPPAARPAPDLQRVKRGPRTPSSGSRKSRSGRSSTVDFLKTVPLRTIGVRSIETSRVLQLHRHPRRFPTIMTSIPVRSTATPARSASPASARPGRKAARPAASRSAAAGPWAPCWPTTSSGPASASSAIVDRDFIETHNLQRQILFDEPDVADNLPKAEAAAQQAPADQLGDHDRAGRHRHRPHQHPRPVPGRRPDPRRHRQLRDPLPDQRRGGEARQAVGLRRRDRQRGADDDDHPRRDAVPALRVRGGPGPGDAGTCETAGVLGPRSPSSPASGGRGDQDPRPASTDALNRELIMVDVWENTAGAQGRRAAGARSTARAASSASSSGSTARTARRRRASAAATPCRCATASPAGSTSTSWPTHLGRAGPGELQHVPAQVR